MALSKRHWLSRLPRRVLNLAWHVELYNHLSPARSLQNTRATFVPEKQAHESLPVRTVTQEHYYLPYLKQTTRFQHKLLSKPITIVNTALFVLNFLNLPQGDI